ncbi:MAG: glycine--tRNA ligase subunit beta [Candidatus Hydrothermales bacterium]
MANYLLEIGTEELPPFEVKSAILKLKEEFEKLLSENKIGYEKINTFATPRRLTLLIENLDERQKEYEEEIKGPPYHISFTKEGEKTEILEKFLESSKALPDSFYVKEEQGKKYIFLKIKKGGKSTKEIIKENIFDILKKIPFPKKMRWGIENLTFARPIRWILSIWNDEILELPLPIFVSNKTKTNRLFNNKEIEIKSIDDYVKVLKSNGVIPDFEERKKIIKEKIYKIANELEAEPILSDEHIEELTGLVEYPGVILCEFPSKFLEIPKEIIFTAMKSHQRYIPLVSKNKEVLPYFVAVINNKEEKADKIKRGLIDVLIARLEDAIFYIKKDNEITLEERINYLKGIVWIKDLGNIYEKNQRVKEITEFLIENSNFKLSQEKEFINKIIDLIRTDLTTEMVRDGKEFTELEGIISSEYAKIQKKDERIVKILREYRLPKTQNDELPETQEGTVISISDKIDTTISLLATGYKIKGSKDPLGLKRTLYSTFYLIIEKEIKFNLEELTEFVINLLKKQNIKINKRAKEIEEEILKRFENYLEELKGIRYDIVDAAIESEVKNLYLIYKKALVLQNYFKREREMFEKIIIGQKRTYNIIKGQKLKGEVKENLFEKIEERILFNKVREIEPNFLSNIEKENFEEALKELLKLREPIDRFFDNVFVMTENTELRENRLNLLKRVWELFRKYGDLSKIVV